jgi:hypothetical protein
MISRCQLPTEVEHHTFGELWHLLVLDVWTPGVGKRSRLELRGRLKSLRKDIGAIGKLIPILRTWNVWSKQSSDSL